MENELIIEKTWFKRNWKWLVPLCAMMLIGVTLLASMDGNVSDFAKAYADTSLCQNAVDKANKNGQVIKALGNLEPIDKLAILEGNAKYSNNGNTVDMTVRVTGTKGKAKMDILADKDGQQWNYKSIKLRIKKTGEEIQVLP